MKIIAFEGIDASGKETQSKRLYQSMHEQGYIVYYASFPRYETPIGRLIKQHLLYEIELSEEAFHMLLEADRFDFKRKLQELENQGYEYVVLDRYTLSNIVFGNSKGIGTEWLLNMQEPLKEADLTFFIDVSVETSVSRRPGGRDKHERDIRLLQDTRNQYIHFSEIHPTIYRIDGERSVEEVAQDVIKTVFDY